MSMRKRYVKRGLCAVFLAALALTLVCGLTLKGSLANFITYVSARGGHVLYLESKTEATENGCTTIRTAYDYNGMQFVLEAAVLFRLVGSFAKTEE